MWHCGNCHDPLRWISCHQKLQLRYQLVVMKQQQLSKIMARAFCHHGFEAVNVTNHTGKETDKHRSGIIRFFFVTGKNWPAQHLHPFLNMLIVKWVCYVEMWWQGHKARVVGKQAC